MVTRRAFNPRDRGSIPRIHTARAGHLSAHFHGVGRIVATMTKVLNLNESHQHVRAFNP